MKGQVSKRFFCTYLALLVCLLLLSMPLYHMVYSLFTQNYLNTNMQMLESGLNQLSGEIEGVSSILQDVFSNPAIMNVRFIKPQADEGDIRHFSTEDYYRSMAAQNEFYRSLYKISIITDCGIVLSNDIIITGKRIHYSGDAFYPDYFQIEGHNNYSEWKSAMIESANISRLVQAQNIVSIDNRSYNALVYLMPMANSASRNNSFFYATIDTQSLVSNLVTQELLENGALALNDLSGALLYSHGNAPQDELVYIEGENSGLGLRATVGISKAFISHQLLPLKQIALVFFALYLLAGLALSGFFTWRSIRPIRSLVSAASSTGGNRLQSESPPVRQGEYQFLMDFISDTDMALEQYQKALSQQKELLRVNLFERMLHGLAFDASDYGRAQAYFSGFPQCYRVAAARLNDAESHMLTADAARRSLILSAVNSMLPPGTHHHFTANLLVLVLPEDEINAHRKLLEALMRALPENTCNRIAFSDLFSGMQELYGAFAQCQRILRQMGIDGESVCGWCDLPASSTSSLPYRHEAARFYQLILRQDSDAAAKVIESALSSMCESGLLSESEVQQVFFTFRQELVLVHSELATLGQELMALPDYDASLDVDTLFNRLKTSAAQACEGIHRRQQDENEAFEHSVFTYINEHIDDINLYIKAVTAHFSIPEARLQAIVRRFSGKSFFEYVEGKRMQMAEQLVCHTDLPITQMVGICGYGTLNSFYKAFRRNFGKSPNTMRKQQAKADSSS
ncbi:MAG: helix-turn-helix domain-containing protein [Christensenellales bacterium]|jgi:AraC-like DNA-binding protein